MAEGHGAGSARDLVVRPWGARFRGRVFPCAIGRGGVLPAAVKREADCASPAGVWRLTRLYWRADRLARPRCCLPVAPLGPQLGWSEAPEDPAYNHAIRHPYGFPADRMARGDPLYDLVAVTDHNAAPVVPGAGSAIFVHLWRKPRHPTAGCIAFRKADLLWILERWDPSARLVIRRR
ncbi:MAG: L,D-transpeptidase family protein [Pseudomonadota bacterium]